MYQFYHSKDKLIESLKLGGILKSKIVEDAMNAVDRKHYCPESPYTDSPQSIGYNATISAPHMHAHCMELVVDLLQKPNCRALDVGSGSGYLVACMGYVMKKAGNGGKAFGIEHIPQLAKLGKQNIEAGNPELLGTYAFVEEGDGFEGLPREAPFDVIHVGASAKEIPEALKNQLAIGGRMIIPVGSTYGMQYLMQYDKQEDGSMTEEQLWGVRYVPLTTAKAQWNDSP